MHNSEDAAGGRCRSLCPGRLLISGAAKRCATVVTSRAALPALYVI